MPESVILFASHPSPSPHASVPLKRQESVVAGVPRKFQKIPVDMEEYNITHVNQKIKAHFKKKRSDTLRELQKELSRALWIAFNGVHSSDRNTANKKIMELRNLIRDLEGCFEYALYLVRTYGILQEYANLAAEVSKISFLGPQKHNATVTQIKQSDTLVNEYLRTAREYVQVKNYVQTKNTLTCRVCNEGLFEEAADDYRSCCLGCGEVQEVIDVTPTFRDSNRINMCSRYTYTRKGHFIDAIKRFQARQNTTIQPDVYSLLQKEIAAHGLTSGTATKEHIYEFLEANRLSRHYGDINLIYSVLTGKRAPDISDYETQLLDLFDETEDAYEQVKDPNRINSLNVNFKLFKLLQKLGYPCKRDDFYILKTAVKWSEHENKWEEIRLLKGWNYIPTIY